MRDVFGARDVSDEKPANSQAAAVAAQSAHTGAHVLCSSFISSLKQRCGGYNLEAAVSYERLMHDGGEHLGAGSCSVARQPRAPRATEAVDGTAAKWAYFT